jgi:hypothetical protein
MPRKPPYKTHRQYNNVQENDLQQCKTGDNDEYQQQHQANSINFFFYLLATTTIPANAGIVEAMKREKSITQAKQITSEVKIALSSGSTQTITETLNKLKQTPQIQDDEKKIL